MIAVDTNILVYAHRRDSPHHHAAQRVLHDLATDRTGWGIAWSCLHEFLAIVTHPRIYQPPTPMSAAVAALTSLLELPDVMPLAETSDHGRILTELLQSPHVVGPRVHDARIAAVCLGHGISTLWSADRDFSWFPRLRVVNPLA